MQNLGAIVEEGTLIAERYRPVKIIGSGATGAVLLVEDTRFDDTRIALKILLAHLLRDDESLSRFRSETRITMSLSHPCIVQTYGLGTHFQDFTFLKMEYCEGKSLRSVITEHPEGLPLDMLLGLVLDIASALSFAHSRGVIHRDLKPENILVDVDGRARLLDFGLAQSVRFDSQATVEGAILGTPYYMSPEQVLSEFTDSGVDIYSFGILLYELVTGQRPYDGATFWQLAQCHLEEELPEVAREGVPTWLLELMNHCCAKRRAKRPATMDIVLERLLERASEAQKANLSVASSKHPSKIQEFSGSPVSGAGLSKRLSYLGWAIFWGAAVVAFFVVPHYNYSARWRYGTCILFVESVLGTEVPALRAAFGIPLDLGYPDSLFGASKTLSEKRRWRSELNSAEFRDYMRPLLYFGHDPNYFDPIRGTYPLHFTLANAQWRGIWDLLDFGADPRLPDARGFRALDYAVRSSSVSLKSVKRLLDAGANPNLSPPGESPPIIVLIRRADDSLLKVLLEHPGLDPNVCDNDGIPALFIALATARPTTVRLLLENGAVGEIVDAEGRSPREYLKDLPAMAEREQLLWLVEKSVKDSSEGSIPCRRYRTSKFPGSVS